MSSAAERSAPYHHGALRDALLTRAAEVIEQSGIEALTLRGLARDLGVSHGAPNRHFRNKDELLAELAALAYEQMREATLGAAEATGDDDPWVRLNAMGRGYLKWALTNRALFAAAFHPDVSRFVTPTLSERMHEFQAAVRQACNNAQAAGRHRGVDPGVLALYTNAVPFGAASLLTHKVFAAEVEGRDIDELVADVIELVVPLRDRAARP